MRKWLPLITLLVGLLIPLSASAAELTMALAINSDVFPCNHQVRYYVWWNPHTVPIQLQWTRVWQGMNLGGQADFFVNLYTYKKVGQAPPYDLIHMSGWDHYANPTTPMTSVWTYTPDWVTIPPGQGILMETACYGVTRNELAHAAAFVGYTK